MSTESASSSASKPSPGLLVDAAIRVIAAGIFEHADGKLYARATLALTPVACVGADTKDAIDLASWPQQVETLLATKGISLDLWDVTTDAGRGGKPDGPPPKFVSLPVTPVKRLSDVKDSLNEYWLDVMGGTDGVKSLARAFAGKAGTLDDVLRASAGNPGGARDVPDIHGTDRSPAAVALIMERAYQIINRLAGRADATRPAPRDNIEDRIWARVWSDTSTPTLIAVTPDERRAAYEKMRGEAIAEEIAAALAGSSARADAVAAARRRYLDANDSKSAIDELKKADSHCNRTPPGACAKAFAINPALGPQLDAAHAAYQAASRTAEPGKSTDRLPADVDGDFDAELEFARRRFFSLQTYPSLARLFRFVIDVQCEVAQLAAKVAGETKPEQGVLDHVVHALSNKTPPSKLPQPSNNEARFFFLSARLQGDGVAKRLPRVWTSAKLRLPNDSGKADATLRGHFYPCTREEMDARAAGEDTRKLREMAIAEQIDGIVDLGQAAACDGAREPRFDIVTLDSITLTAGDLNYERARSLRASARLKNQGDLPIGLLDDERTPERGTLRTSGLALVDRWRQTNAIARHLASSAQHDAIGTKKDVLLDASDVTIGYKLDVGVKSKRDDSDARRRWHTLMRRKVEFHPYTALPANLNKLDATLSGLYPDRLSRIRADDGLLSVPAALRDWSNGSSPKGAAKTTAFTEEIIGSWRGDPLGLSCGKQTYRLSQDDIGVNIKFDLPTRSDSDAFTPPPLRFGWRYHLGLRAVYAGGVAMPLERALGHYELSHDRTLVLPPVTEPGRVFRRHERIDAPVATVPQWAFGTAASPGSKLLRLPGRNAAEQTARMIVRTITDGENAEVLGFGDNPIVDPDHPAQEPRISRRILIPPAVALDFAGLHGALDGGKTEQVELFEPRITDEQDRPAGDECCVDDFTVTGVPGAEQSTTIWKKVKVAWRRIEVTDRPVGGLKGVDYHAAWGGFPVFRMRSSNSTAPAPADGQPVIVSGEAVTDYGEIVDRAPKKTALKYKQPSGGEIQRFVEWSPAAGVPSGAAVFRPLAADRGGATQRAPYYPDPGAQHMVIEVDVHGGPKRHQVVPLYRDDRGMPKPTGYPDVLPVLLDVVAAPTTQRELVRLAEGISVYEDKKLLAPHQGAAKNLKKGHAKPKEDDNAILVRQVIVALAPGEEATIRTWCLPSLGFLKYMFEGTESAAALCVACGCVSPSALKDAAEANSACRAGFAALGAGKLAAAVDAKDACAQGVGGLRLPSQEQIDALAAFIHDFMMTKPLSEISAILELGAVHAVDRPAIAPSFLPADDSRGYHGLRLLRTRSDEKWLNDILQAKTPSDDSALLWEPSNWKLDNHPDGGIGVLLSGTIALHAPSTGAVEIYARGAAAARGRFDDPDRGRSVDDQVRGLWPQPDGEKDIRPKDLFGFTPAADGRVALNEETVTLLRIEGFEPNEDVLDLLAVQRRAADPSNTSALRAIRPASFPDARARYITFFATAIARHGPVLRTRYDELLPNLSKDAAPPKDAKQAVLRSMWLPATVRPARIAPLSLIPSFVWVAPKCGDGEIGVERRMCVRVRMRRPWFSSGEGERIGVVLWPPQLFDLKSEDVQQDRIIELTPGRGEILLNKLPPDSGDLNKPTSDRKGLDALQDLDLGPGGAWVTRWGADPIRPGSGVNGWLLSPDNFKGFDHGKSHHFLKAQTVSDQAWDAPPDNAPPDGAVVAHALMPVPVAMDAEESRAAEPKGGFMSVALATYEARFDPEQQNWYADVYIDPLKATCPFVRVGLVRYQPHAPDRLKVSEPIVEWIQIMPTRNVSASIGFDTAADMALIYVKTSGPAQSRGDDQGERSSAQRPRVRLSLLRSVTDANEASGEWVHETQEPTSATDAGGIEWNTTFLVPKADFMAPENSWSVYVEEVERMRPATYQDEPRPGTANDTVFAETGPRFAAKLELNPLRKPI
ncbi:MULTISPECIES: hypothetical protein [unclassified Bradyrhizobium]|uniref:hypothetical protein n=1 Tax=unclassified Bradyrhizobium TaxID=2631580 RepID=UPI00291620AB|nr:MULTISPECIES: hypothetical protein [unclassified Bradyrhizobium]